MIVRKQRLNESQKHHTVSDLSWRNLLSVAKPYHIACILSQQWHQTESHNDEIGDLMIQWLLEALLSFNQAFNT